MVTIVLAGLLVPLVLLAWFVWSERRRGRLGPVKPVPASDPAWLAEHLFRYKPEVAAVLWTASEPGPDAVAALISRLELEGKIATFVEDHELVLTLRVDRGQLGGYERQLIDALFFAGDRTGTAQIRKHYGRFKPAKLLEPELNDALRAELGPFRSWLLPVWLPELIAVSVAVYYVLEFSAILALVSLGVLTLITAFGADQARHWRIRPEWGLARGRNFLPIACVPVAIALSYALLSAAIRTIVYELNVAAMLLALANCKFVLEIARSRESRRGTAVAATCTASVSTCTSNCNVGPRFRPSSSRTCSHSASAPRRDFGSDWKPTRVPDTTIASRRAARAAAAASASREAAVRLEAGEPAALGSAPSTPSPREPAAVPRDRVAAAVAAAVARAVREAAASVAGKRSGTLDGMSSSGLDLSTSISGATFDLSSRKKLTRRDVARFPSATLFHKLGRVLCEAECLPRRELFEAWAVARRARRKLRGGRIVDVACGHGLVAWLMLLLDDTSPNALAIDVRLPPSAPRVAAALAAAWPRLSGRVALEPRALADIRIEANDVVVATHACGALTDAVIDAVLAARARLTVLPCCHDEATCDAGGLSGWLDLGTAVDATRAARLRAHGYAVHTQCIPREITAQNRLLIAMPAA